MKQSTSPTPTPAYPALLRWLRATWLWRQADRFWHPRPQPAPPRPKAPPHAVEALEQRNTTDPVLTVGAGGLLLGSAMAALVPPIATPAQVLLRGDWGPGQPSFDPQALQRDAGTPPLRRLAVDASTAYFTSLSIAPFAAAAPVESVPAWATYTSDRPPQDVQASPEGMQLASAESALRSPALDNFLTQLENDLKGPLPATSDNTGLHASPAEVHPPPPSVEGGGGGALGSAVPADAPGLNAAGSSGSNLAQTLNANGLASPSAAAVAAPGVPVTATAAGSSNPSGGTSPSAVSPNVVPVVGALFSGTAVPTQLPPLPPAPVVPTVPPVLQAGFGNLPLAFEPNQGQADAGTAFVARGQGYGIALGANGITLRLQKPASAAAGADPATPPADVLQVGFAGADPSAPLVAQGLLPSRSNYFLGGAHPVQLTDVAQYGQVTQSLAPGVSVVYHGNGQDLQFDLHVAPGADPSAVNLVYKGAQSVTVDGQGRVLLHTAGGDVVQQAPVLYQDQGGSRQTVAGHYVARGGNAVGFQVDGAYNHAADLVLDPTLSFSTYLGGSRSDYGTGIATDLQGNSYVVGSTGSTNFPTLNPYQQFSGVGGSGTDVFISKFSPSGALLYSTYIGGTFGQSGYAIAADVAGNAYVTGSGSNDYPTTAGAYQTNMTGDPPDVFVTKLSPAGNALIYSTFLGGSSSQQGSAIALDAAGDAFVTGFTSSTDFPTVHAAQSSYGGGFNDAFVTELNPSGGALVYSTFLGGSGTDTGNGIAVDAAGHAFVTGTAGPGFPTTAGAFQTSMSGTQSAAFVTRLSTSGSALDYSTLLGGSTAAQGNAIAVDRADRASVTGSTSDTDFPTTAGAYQSSLAGMASAPDAFVTRLSASGSALSYSTYLGGSQTDTGLGIAVDSGNNAYVAGATSSTNFPTASAAQSSAGGADDAFVARVNDGGTSLGWSTYLGGSGTDQANGIALDADANVVVAGQTASTNFPTVAPFQGSNGGMTDAFVARYNQLVPPVFSSISPDTGVSSTDQVTTSQNLTLYGTALSGSTVTLYRAGLGQIGTATASGAGLWTFSYSGTTLPEGSYGFTATDTVSGKISPESPPFLVTVDTTAPTVTLRAPSSTVDPTPSLTVVATDLVGLPRTATVTLDVDLNDNGTFTDPGESGYQTATLTNGVAVFSLTPALAAGTYPLRARVTDRAGNQGQSAVTTLVLSATGSAWTLTDTTPIIDPFTGNAQLQRGDLTLSQALDLDRSPGTSVGGDPALVYHSERASVEPIVQAQVQSDSSVALPATITAQLTWNGTPQTAQTYNTTGLAAGDLLTLAQQVSSPVTTTGRDTYTLTVTMNYSTPIVRSLSGMTYVDSEDASPFGAGWTFGSTDRLVSIAAGGGYPAGLLRVSGSGGVDFYAQSGSSYTSPAGDAGTLSAVGGNYQYATPDGRTWNFNSSGQETSFVSADGLATIAYGYAGSNLTSVSSPDGALTTLAYSSGVASTIKTDARTVTLTLSSGNLTGIANPDGGLRTIVYDATHHPTQDRFGSLSTTYAYSNRALSGTTPGDGGAFSLSPANLFGLATLVEAPAPSLTDPLGRITRAQLDAFGRPVQVLAADGGLTQDVRNSNGWVTQETDPLGRITTFTLDAAGYPTQVTLPDGNTRKYQYQTAFHALTQYTDENGKLWTSTYDTGGHTLTAKDPLNEVTSYTYLSNGLLQTVTDPLNHTTTYGYDTARRPSTMTDALAGVATVSYDGNGNPATQVDPLGRTTTFVNDALGRVLQGTDPTGASTTYAYSGSGQLLSSTDALGHVTSHVYNTRGLQTAQVEAVGTAAQRATLWNFDAAGQLASTRDADGNSTTFAYDPVGRPASQTDPLGDVTAGAYDLAGQRLQQRNALGEATNYAYNNRGWVTKTTDALGNATTVVFDAHGNATARIDPLGNTTSVVYDTLNRPVATVAAVGTSVQRTTTAVYDAAGNVYQTVDALGRITEYDRDALNRVTTMVEARSTADQRSTTYAYDKTGNQISTTDPRGIVTNQTFDGANRVTVRTEAAGTADQRVTTAVYDAAGNVQSVTNGLGQVTSYGYDALNRKVTEIDAYGTSLARTLTTTYDALDAAGTTVDALGYPTQGATDPTGRPTFAINALGQATRSYPGATGNVDAVVDANGNRTQTLYDLDGRPVAVTDALGHTATTVYDAAGNTIATVDPNGNRTTYGYDALNRRVTATDALNAVTTVVLDAADNVSATVDALGNRTSYAYDNLNRRTVTTDALNHLATVLYDSDNNVQATVDANGNRTTYAYDNLNRQVTVTDALGHLATTVSDKADNVTAQVDANGNRTTYGYDALNRKVTMTDALNEVTTTVYDAADNGIATVDANGNRTTFGYDATNRQITVTDALNHTMTVVFDAAGNQVESLDALGNATTFGYDALNRRVSTQDPGGGIATTVYDADGNTVNTIDALGNKGTFAYDALNRQTKAVDALSGTTSYVYDAVGNRTVLIDPVGNRTTFVFDAVNRVTQETDPLGNSATYAYDAGNRKTSQTDRLGRRDDFSYDGVNRLLTEVMRDNTGLALNTLTLTYDANGNMLTAGDSHGTYTMAYDALNRTSVVNGLFGVTLTNTYDAVGNRTVVKDSFGGTATSVYDAASQLTSKQFTDGTTPMRFDLAYTARNQVQSLTRYSDLAGSTKVGVTSYAYDAVGRVQNIQHKNGTSTVLANYTYTYDLASRVTAEKLNGTATSYSYDSTSQLTNDGTNAYSFDANGNRTMTGYATGTGNQLTNDGVYTYTYDAEGNLTKKSKGASAETWTYSYDNRNQLIGVQERATDGGTLLLQATYTYDVFNHRIQEDKWLTGSGSTTVRLAYDVDGTVFADLHGSNSLQTRYWYRPGAVAPVARLASGSATWLLEDRLGSVRNSMDGTGAVTGTVVYDGFGKITTETSAAATGRYAYTGLFQDRDLKLVFADRREYDPATGRWLQRDPIQFQAGDADLYRYVGNDVTNHTDQMGLAADEDSDLPRIAAAANIIAAEQWRRVNAGMEPTDARVIRILEANRFLPSQLVLADQLIDVMIQEAREARQRLQRSPRPRVVFTPQYEPDITPSRPLGRGDLVVLSANRANEAVTDDQFKQVANSKGFKIAIVARASGRYNTYPDHISSNIASVAEFRNALDSARRRWGTVDRILVKSHCGGPYQQGPSIQFDPKAPALTAESLDPATIRSIQGALNPNGVFVISTCGFKLHGLLNTPIKGERFLSPQEWDKEFQRWANKLNRKVTADWAMSSPDTLWGSNQSPPKQWNERTKEFETYWLGKTLQKLGFWHPLRASAVPERIVSDSVPYKE